MTVLLRLRFLFVALAVALLNAGMPVLGYAAMAGNGGLAQVVCTPTGMQTIVVDADGQAHAVDSLPGHGDHCALCVMPLAPAATRSTPPAPDTSACSSLRTGQRLLPSGPSCVRPPATGPPARA